MIMQDNPAHRQCLKYSQQPAWHNEHVHLSYFDAQFELQQAVLSKCFKFLLMSKADSIWIAVMSSGTGVVFISTAAVVWCYLSVPRLYVQSRWGAFPWRWRAPWLSDTERWPVKRRYAHCCLREGWQLLGEGVSAHRQTNTVVRHDFIIVSDFSGEVLIKWPQGVFTNE